MQLGIANIEQLPWQTRIAIEDMEVGVSSGWGIEHAADGSHKDVRALTVTLTALIADSDAILNPTQVTGNQHNYNPTGTGSAAPTLDRTVVLRVDSSAAITVSGIAAPAVATNEANRKGLFLWWLNRSSFVHTLSHNSSSSSVQNRIHGPNSADVHVQPGGSVRLWYDGSTGGYRVLQIACLNAGTYTPTLTKITNLSGTPNAYQCQWMRVGNTVTVSGRFGAEPTAANALTELAMSLPIASAISDAQNVGGTAVGIRSTPNTEACSIEGDATNDRALIKWESQATSDHDFFFTFTYLVM